MRPFVDFPELTRHRAFLKREPADRPLVAINVGFFMPQAYPRLSRVLPRGPVSPEDIRLDLFLEDTEQQFHDHVQAGGDYPFVAAPFIYLPWMEAIMGCPIQAAENSMWAEPAIEDLDTWRPRPRPLNRIPWAQKLLELTAAVVKHSDGRFPVGTVLMRGPADILSAMRGASRFAVDFYDYPDQIRQALAFAADVWIEVGKAQHALIPTSPNGYMSIPGLRSWGPERVIWLQEDAMALLSPRFFREFVLPQDRRISAEFPYTSFHLHGSALWAINDLVQVPGIKVLELNYESALVDVEGTFAGWHTIQAHKPLVIWKQYDGEPFWPWLDRVLAEFPPAGLCLDLTAETAEEGAQVRARVMERMGH